MAEWSDSSCREEGDGESTDRVLAPRGVVCGCRCAAVDRGGAVEMGRRGGGGLRVSGWCDWAV